MTHQRKAEDIAAGNWEKILVAAGLDPAYLVYKEGPCPICGGNTRFRWRADRENGICSHCPGPSKYANVLNGFRILQHLLGKEFKDVADWIRERYGVDATQGEGQQSPVLRRPTPTRAPHEDTEQLRGKYSKLWSEGFQILDGMPAHTYLKTRCPTIRSIPKVLRAHPGLDFWIKNEETKKYESHGVFPAMLAIAQGIDGRAVNIWRTYLNAEGTGKAPFDDAKKAAGRFLQPSFAVRLVEPVGDELGIAEGIETALAVWLLFGIPCWSVLNAGGMEAFEMPAGYEHVKKLRIFGDNDAPDSKGRRRGNEASDFLKEKMRSKGLKSTVILPKFTTFDFGNVAEKLAA